MTSFASEEDLMYAEADLLTPSMYVHVLEKHKEAVSSMKKLMQHLVKIPCVESVKSEGRYVVLKCLDECKRSVVGWKADNEIQADLIAHKARAYLAHPGSPLPLITPTSKDRFACEADAALSRFQQSHSMKDAWAYLVTRPMYGRILGASKDTNNNMPCEPTPESMQRTFDSIDAATAHLRMNEFKWMFDYSLNPLLTEEDDATNGVRRYSLEDCVRMLQKTERFSRPVANGVLQKVSLMLGNEEKSMRFDSGNRAMRFLILHYPILFLRHEEQQQLAVTEATPLPKSKATTVQ
jgi:hypothetical protein